MTPRDRGRARPAVWAGALVLVGSTGVAAPAWATTSHGQNPAGQTQGNDHGQGPDDDTSSSHGQPAGDDSPASRGQQSAPQGHSGATGPNAQADGGASQQGSPSGGPSSGQHGGQDSRSRPSSAGSASPGADRAATASSDAGPAGNNGHIQIDEFAPDGGNGNDPHVTCGLTVSFFGFDGGNQTASITVTPWAPTGGGSPYLTTYQLQNQTRTGGDQFDGSDSIPWSALAPSFSGTAPAHQGYHARVEVAVPHSNGADTKSHMVWIQPCASTTPGAQPAGAPSGPVPSHTAANGPARTGIVAELCTEMASVDVSALPGELGTYFEAVESVLCSPQTTATPGNEAAVALPSGTASATPPAVEAESGQNSAHETTSEAEESESGSSQQASSQATPAVPGHSQQTEEATSQSEESESAPSTTGPNEAAPAGHSQQTGTPGVPGVAVPAVAGPSVGTPSAATPSVAAPSVAGLSIAAPSVAAKSLVSGIALAQTAGVSPAVEASNLVAAASTPAPAVTVAAPTPAATPAGSSLPFTGADVALETAAGAALLGGGFALRRLVRRRRRA